ncbi:hypothetical protein [Leptothoe spongobia]|uniref:DUF4157 domain-containing protein n=1 Tax=Leptothoe spongobia TAU-MAC 1115 TaxID=1967444 RepID=A0A947DDS8_9CYAN|nr:hypothetical protein [Leptothoe spongobia]MBT9314489.1 hypothetical protein [Leptothoe spongobia TAU-MAC 1115]
MKTTMSQGYSSWRTASRTQQWHNPWSDKKKREEEATGYQGQVKSNAESPGHVRMQEQSGGQQQVGLPKRLRSGIENLSGYSMADVRVEYNSSVPGKYSALGYAKGRTIHLAKGAENYLPHEAWHMVQQKQGRRPNTTETEGGQTVSTDSRMESEATEKGRKSMQIGEIGNRNGLRVAVSKATCVMLGGKIGSPDWCQSMAQEHILDAEEIKIVYQYLTKITKQNPDQAEATLKNDNWREIVPSTIQEANNKIKQAKNKIKQAKNNNSKKKRKKANNNNNKRKYQSNSKYEEEKRENPNYKKRLNQYQRNQPGKHQKSRDDQLSEMTQSVKSLGTYSVVYAQALIKVKKTPQQNKQKRIRSAVKKYGTLSFMQEQTSYKTRAYPSGFWANNTPKNYAVQAQGHAKAAKQKHAHRDGDAEPKALAAVQCFLDAMYTNSNKPDDVKGTLKIVTSQGPCPVCRELIDYYATTYPKLDVNVKYKENTASRKVKSVGFYGYEFGKQSDKYKGFWEMDVLPKRLAQHDRKKFYK